MKKMKKIVSIFFLIFIFFLPTTTNATGAISTDEQRILDSLNKGVTMKEGEKFFLSAYDIQQAENDLKTHDYSVEVINTVIEHIEAARQLAMDNSAGIKAKNLHSFLRQLPENAQDEIRNHIFEAARALGFSVDSNWNIVDKRGNDVFVATTTNNPIIKTTGVSLASPLFIIVSLLTLTVVTGFMSKRKGASC